MAGIPKQAIKKMIKQKFGLQITEDAAGVLALMLEKKARKISEFAVGNAKKNKRGKVIKKDIEDYVIKVGMDDN